MSPEEFLMLFFVWILGSIVGTTFGLIITGFLADRFVIRKILQNEEVQDLINLFREGKAYLKEILENQKKKHE